MQLQLQADIDFTTSMVEERNRNIDSVTSDVAQVAELFRDLHGLVVDQGIMLSQVEKNVDEAEVTASRGVEFLREADASDKSARCTIT